MERPFVCAESGYSRRTTGGPRHRRGDRRRPAHNSEFYSGRHYSDFEHTEGLGIGSLAGLGTGAVVSFVLLAGSHHFYVQEGSPLEISLPQPVTLAQTQTSQTDNAAAASAAPVPNRPPPSPMPASVEHGTCF